jgi:hypothetical protein
MLGDTYQVTTTKGNLHRPHEVNAERRSRDEDDEATDLGDGVDPDGEASRDQALEDGADGEEDDHGQRG